MVSTISFRFTQHITFGLVFGPSISSFSYLS
uniref:Uncharacterized protein n=1 Tax=Arundo donax TaxID=35708 RepID=A0A0A9HDJ9_ARUDO